MDQLDLLPCTKHIHREQYLLCGKCHSVLVWVCQVDLLEYGTSSGLLDSCVMCSLTAIKAPDGITFFV